MKRSKWAEKGHAVTARAGEAYLHCATQLLASGRVSPSWVQAYLDNEIE